MSGSGEFRQWTGVVLFILIAVVCVAIAVIVMGVTGPMGIEERFTSAVGLHQEPGASPETGSAFSLEGHPLLYALFLAVLLIAGFLLYRKYNILQGTEQAQHPFNEMDQSAILEVGNIMVSSFLSATSDLLGFIMLPSPPVLVFDMAHAAITSLIAQMTVEVDDVILFRVELKSEEYNIAGNILIFLEISTLQKVATRLEELTRQPV